jgi:hypothetical protein
LSCLADVPTKLRASTPLNNYFPFARRQNDPDREFAAVRRRDPTGGRGEGERWAGSDWIAVERERGASVSSVVVSFDHKGLAFGLLDLPNHQGFRKEPIGSGSARINHSVVIIA